MAVFLQPPLLVYVITLVPAETPVTSPVLLTVATAVAEDTHALLEDGKPVPVSWVLDPVQTVNVPVIDGIEFTVTVAVAIHPAMLVKVIALVPAPVPVTSPLLFAMATSSVDDTHGLDEAAVPVPVSCVVDPKQTSIVPVMEGTAFTVTVAVLVHPPILV